MLTTDLNLLKNKATLAESVTRKYPMALCRYKNLSSTSGVAAYEIGDDYIKVKFVDGPVYLYTHDTPGSKKVTRMKKLAQAGKGLSTFISQHVKDRYAARLR